LRDLNKQQARRHDIRQDEDFHGMGEILTERPFLADIMKIRDSKGFRRLTGKAQVFSMPLNPHVRTRLTHSEEVASAATLIAEHLKKMEISEQLCQAIALGHDVGHAPYGHQGESFISKKTNSNFKHEIFSVIVCQQIERSGDGLNLTRGTLEGILYHSLKGAKFSDHRSELTEILPEYKIVMYCDKICYTFSDLNDAFKRGYVKEIDLPNTALKLGKKQRERMANCTNALIRESLEKNEIIFQDSEEAQTFTSLRGWMYDNVYGKNNSDIHYQILNYIYDFFATDPAFEKCDPAVLLALLTDRETNQLGWIFLENRIPEVCDLANFGIMELLSTVKEAEIDFTDPKLNW